MKQSYTRSLLRYQRSQVRYDSLPEIFRKPATAVALATLAEKEFGGLDILINNAGVFKPKPFVDLSEEEYDWFLNTILKGKFFMAQAAAKSMKKRGGGAIVQTGALWALQVVGATPSAAYSAANAGVHALVHNLALDWPLTRSELTLLLRPLLKLPYIQHSCQKKMFPKSCPHSMRFIR